MIAQLYEETRLDELLSLGGAELRDHFLADIQRCQAQLTQSMTLAASDQRQGLEQSRRVLHELRGISLTIGAAPLVKLCAEAEAYCDMGSLQDVIDRHADILTMCAALSDRISAHSAGLS
jgi:HPt (histidine-containing phosphotransfer) domain-containing protein